ncbi:putative PEP-binding protein [Crocosphaera chwakensis]|uniref:Phosphoenolpyruvate synthase n=1 Tax=Crocosphaera chwakensis CCY0110 TaxID=391612 RepID=A3ISI6_9CHRO|nr:putative PEP-binding protein [Crocosphaera chwakensis]EAZ90556.1 phosphoenolpyruvate synthase [Crocosphaera chwakensis CCY0110]
MIKLYWLSEINLRDRPVVGEKAWILSQLKQNGYNVFPGFVISSSVFREFLDNLNNVNSLLADFPGSSLHLDVDNPRILQLVAQQSRQSIVNLPFPSQWRDILVEATKKLETDTLILRTSLGGDFFLNQDISGLTPAQVCWNIPEHLETAIKEIWAQLLKAKSLFYWQRLGIGIDQLNLAILVQPMVTATSSGRMINRAKYFEIEGNWGLGYSLLQGEILPDYWKIIKNSGEILEHKLGNQSRAYRLKEKSKLSKLSTQKCLEYYCLSNEKQEQYCLDSEEIAQITQLFNNLQNDAISWHSLEWIFYTSDDNSSSKLAIAQLTSLPYDQSLDSTKLETQINQTQAQSQLTGIGAAPGQIQGTVYLLNEDNNSNLVKLTNSIIVTQKIHPFQLSSIKQALGVITEEGGTTSHAAILARELGIPAVVGVPGATSWLQTGDSILLDGDNGTIILNTANLSSQQKMSLQAPNLPLEKQSFLNYPIGTKLMVNLSQRTSLEKITNLPWDGLGLMRSELMLLDLCTPHSLREWLTQSQSDKIIEQLKQRISEFAEVFHPYPIFYRTFDDKFSVDQDRRGTSGYCIDPTLFRLELQALSEVQQQGHQNISIILPFVRTVDEFQFCLNLIEDYKLLTLQSFQVWIMVEVPSIIFQLSDYVKAGVQGIAIGTNDLIPLLLGRERNKVYSNQISFIEQSAITSALKQLIEEANRLEIPSSICGQIAVDSAQIIEQLITWGITTISVEPEAIEKTYQTIARAEKRIILKLARERR